MLDEQEVKQLIATELHCVHDFDVHCDVCRLRAMCLPAALTPEEIEALERVIDQRLKIPAREYVYREGQSFTCIYAVIYGSVKTYFTDAENRAFVTSFHLPGELFGFSGIDKGSYAVNATALQDTGLCAIPFDELEETCRSLPGLQSRLLHMMSDRIVDYQRHFTQLRSANTVRKRVAGLLLSLSTRSARRRESASRIHLPMTGDDTASYLGISAETLSREFSRLSREGAIAKDKRDVTIQDMAQLQRIVSDSEGQDR